MHTAFVLALLLASPSLALAQSTAEKVFGTWEKVAIEDIKKLVPEFEYERVSLGSVTNEYRAKKAPPCTLGNVVYLGGYPCRKPKDNDALASY